MFYKQFAELRLKFENLFEDLGKNRRILKRVKSIIYDAMKTSDRSSLSFYSMGSQERVLIMKWARHNGFEAEYFSDSDEVMIRWYWK